MDVGIAHDLLEAGAIQTPVSTRGPVGANLALTWAATLCSHVHALHERDAAIQRCTLDKSFLGEDDNMSLISARQWGFVEHRVCELDIFRYILWAASASRY